MRKAPPTTQINIGRNHRKSFISLANEANASALPSFDLRFGFFDSDVAVFKRFHQKSSNLAIFIVERLLYVLESIIQQHFRK